MQSNPGGYISFFTYFNFLVQHFNKFFKEWVDQIDIYKFEFDIQSVLDGEGSTNPMYMFMRPALIYNIPDTNSCQQHIVDKIWFINFFNWHNYFLDDCKIFTNLKIAKFQIFQKLEKNLDCFLRIIIRNKYFEINIKKLQSHWILDKHLGFAKTSFYFSNSPTYLNWFMTIQMINAEKM